MYAARLAIRLLLVTPLFASGCTEAPPPDPGNATYKVRESVRQLQVTHAAAGETLTLVDAKGAVVQTATADMLGSAMFREVAAGSGYLVKDLAATPVAYSRALTVTTADAPPPADLYTSQPLAPGFNYIRTRDGTTLSAFVTLPGPAEMGPYPTVVDYSGYDPSRPGDPIKSFTFLCDQFPSVCAPPSDPSGLLASLLGFATVSVNVRGTGCSGGAFDYFEVLQVLDGYDVIETVAAQPWVAHHKVGMTGLSYPGISQLFVAASRPPSLAAISPLSVVGNIASTLIPGGMLNDGFAINWVSSVLERAAPYGQGWERGRVDAGDTVCGENQLLHGQKVDNVAQARMTPYYIPALHDRLNPTTFVNKIKVPVFLAGGWQDEQTGPFFTTLLDRFTGSPLVRVTTYNGIHEDGFSPEVFAEWKAFLDLYVAQRKPEVSKPFRDMAPAIFDYVYHSSMRLPADRFAGFADYAAALAAYEKEPMLRVIFDRGSGSGGSDVGAPVGAFEQKFSRWPPTETVVRRYYPHADGTLADARPTEAAAASSFLLDPAEGHTGNCDGDLGALLPKWNWKPLAAGKAAVFETAPLAADMVLMGTGSADLWLKSTADEADLQVSLSEVRPDGNEMYVQSGWLRASFRAVGADSTELWPSPTYLKDDIKALVPGEWTQVRVPIAASGHAFRTGSRLRITVDTPGGTRPDWRFDLRTFSGPVTHTIGHDQAHPSSFALALIPGVTVPTSLPACPSLRGQPCRTWAAYTNTPAQ